MQFLIFVCFCANCINLFFSHENQNSGNAPSDVQFISNEDGTIHVQKFSLQSTFEETDDNESTLVVVDSQESE